MSFQKFRQVNRSTNIIQWVPGRITFFLYQNYEKIGGTLSPNLSSFLWSYTKWKQLPDCLGSANNTATFKRFYVLIAVHSFYFELF